MLLLTLTCESCYDKYARDESARHVTQSTNNKGTKVMNDLACIAIALTFCCNSANAADNLGVASPDALNAAKSFIDESLRFRSALPQYFDVDGVSKCGAVYTFVAEHQIKGDFPKDDDTNYLWALMLESYKFMRNFYVFKGMPADLLASTADRYVQILINDPSQQALLIADCRDRLVASINSAKE